MMRPPRSRRTPPGAPSHPSTIGPMKTVTFETNKGTITAELYPDEAPVTVENFEKLIKSGFYDGIVFHRVIPDFVVQGGDPLTKELPMGDRRIGTGGPGWKIKCETAGNPHRHEAGSLSMAHAGKDTGGSQFFIVLSEANTRHLNGVHTVFGKVTEGMDVVRQLAAGDKMEKVTVSDA
jgi:peptidyl-prolyl cis-trans isomerase B (cyclophilin B)